MARTIVQTTSSGWFINAADPDGPRVRKKEGDTVLSLAEYQAQKSGDGYTPSQQRAASAAKGSHQRKAERNKPKGQTKGESKIGPTGKTLVGKTTVIKCKFKGTDNKTGPECGKEREIKVQDAFQVKYCPDHQQEHRRIVKRDKLREKRQEAKAAKAAAAK